MKGDIFMSKRVFLYGFDNLHRVVNYKFITEENFSIREINRVAEYMRYQRDDIVHIYCVDDRPGLKRYFNEVVKNRHFTKDFEFEDMISRDGIKIL